jgi:hypothetical protein
MPATVKKSLSVAKGAGGGGKQETALRTALGSSDFYLPFFHFLTIPKNTAIASYVSYTLPLPISQSERIWLEFPKGCAGLVGIQLVRGTVQIFPLPTGTWFKTETPPISFKLSHLFDTEPYEITIRGYNLDDTYEHTPWIALELHGLTKDVPPKLQEFMNFIQGS